VVDPLEHLMLTPHSAARYDLSTDLAIPLVAAEGLGALTPRAIGELAGCSRQAVHQWFGDQTGLRRAVAARFTSRWVRWTDVRVYLYGVLGLLPDSSTVREWTRVWLSFIEAAPRDSYIADCIAAGRSREVEVITAQLGPTLADGVHALVEGLRWRVAASEDNYPPGRAAAVLASALARVPPQDPLGRLA
jgi:AcrR family transcriptional regulator